MGRLHRIRELKDWKNGGGKRNEAGQKKRDRARCAAVSAEHSNNLAILQERREMYIPVPEVSHLKPIKLMMLFYGIILFIQKIFHNENITHQIKQNSCFSFSHHVVAHAGSPNVF